MNNVFSVNITATGSVYGQRARVKMLNFVTTSTAGSIVLRDGGATGTVLFKVDTPAAVDLYYISLPDSGILFETDVHATLTDVSSLTTVMG